jgi:hypothetical protein
MKTWAPPARRRALLLAAAGVLAIVLTGCTGRGGGRLPPDASLGFNGAASFGFSFSCEDSGGINPPTGQLRIQLSYTDHGSNPIGSPFSIHGTADVIDAVLESQICIGQNPPPSPVNQLIFLGRYSPTSSAPVGLPATCRSAPLCRFEVIVQDNDRNLAPSPGDFFSIRLSKATALTSALDPLTVFYTRAGYLSSGNLTVD